MAERDERHGRHRDDAHPHDRDEYGSYPGEDEARGRVVERPADGDYGREREVVGEAPYEVEVVTDEGPASHERVRRVRDPETGAWVTTERVRRKRRGPSFWVRRVGEFIDYAFYLLYGLIVLEIVLELFGARDQAQFKRFIDTVTAPFLKPFRGVVADPRFGASEVMLSYVIALLFYLLVQLAIRGLLRLFAQRRVTA